MIENTVALSALLEKTERIVREAGALVVEESRKPRDIRHKGRIDLVTSTDIAVEDFLKSKLAALLPRSSFLAEESAADAALADWTWIIDPIDGTTNYAHGVPVVATSVGLWHDGQIVLGVVNLPLLGECFTALRGQGAFLNGDRLAVSATGSMTDALIATGFPYDVTDQLPVILERLKNILPAAQGVRRFGAAAVDLAYVAAGRFDAFYEGELNPWDVAAGWLLVEEAGGTITCMNGAPYQIRTRGIVASNGRVHDALCKLL